MTDKAGQVLRMARPAAYWARLKFSGRTQPPHRVPDAAAAMALVASDPSAIAFVEGGALDARARVLFRLDP